ncbi:MAG: hypothetical protein ACI8RD_001734 [Bacillariaceae sp.]|jgi:hypothetical protein
MVDDEDLFRLLFSTSLLRSRLESNHSWYRIVCRGVKISKYAFLFRKEAAYNW